MMILVVLTTILSLLAWWAVPEVSAQGELHFDYHTFDASSRSTLNVLFNASIDTIHQILKVTDPSDNWCNSHVCRGQIIYSTAIDFINRPLRRTYSFSTSFVFSLTIPGTIRSGEGFVFFLIANPYQTSGNGIGDYFGAFPSNGQSTTPTIAVEFDTLKNPVVYDINDNHVGIDINKAESAMAVSCSSINVDLSSAVVTKIIAWIDYHDSIKSLEVRLAYWSPTVVRPETPLLDMSLDLTPLVDNKMYAGFSGESYNGQEQESAIYSWSFHSKLEAPAPPPPPRVPVGVIINGTAPAPNPWEVFPPRNSTTNSTERRRQEMLIIGICVGGGVGLILALAVCFCLGYYCNKRLASAARSKADALKNAEEAAYAGDTENAGDLPGGDTAYARFAGVEGDSGDAYAGYAGGEGAAVDAYARGEGAAVDAYAGDDRSRGGGEGEVEEEERLVSDVEEGSSSDYLTKRGRSLKIVLAKDVDDPTFLALRKGSPDYYRPPRRVKSARELEGDGVEAEAIRRGILEIEGVTTSVMPYKRRSLSYSNSGADGSVNSAAKGTKTWSPTSAGFVPLHEEQFPGVAAASSPEEGEGEAEREEGVLAELPVTDLAEEESSGVSPFPTERTGEDWQGDDDPGKSDTVYEISSNPSASMANHAARRNNSWSLWSSETEASSSHRRRQSSPVPYSPSPMADFQVKRKSSWNSWSPGPTRLVQVVVKRSEAISPRNVEDSPRRIQAPSSYSDIEVLPERGEGSSSPTAGTIMYTNTLYDLPVEEPQETLESRQPSRSEDDCMMDDIYVRPQAENIYDRPPVQPDYGEQIVERIFDVEITKEEDDVDRIFDVPQTLPQREIIISSVIQSPASSPIPSRAPSNMPSPTASRSVSPRPSPAGTLASSSAGASGSTSTDTAKESEQRRVKTHKPHWRY